MPQNNDNNDSAEFDPKSAVYTPLQVATYGLNAVREANKAQQAGLGIGIPIPQIEDYFPPVPPAHLCAIIGQTTNYKSGFVHFLEQKHAEHLNKIGVKDTIIIHVSVEEMIEDQSYLELARYSGYDAGDLGRGIVQDWDKLEQAAMHVGNIPIYRIGESLARADDMPQLYITNMKRAIDTLVNGDILDWKPKVAGIFFDYLQAFPIDPTIRRADRDAQRRLQVRSDIYTLRQCAAKYNCPVFVAVQAKQKLDGAQPPLYIPGKYDGEESSAIGQRADRIISLWMPKNDNQVGSMVVPDFGSTFIVAENMLFIKIAKQRGRLPSGKTYLCQIDYATNDISLI
jgi:hypothetical protein